MKINLTTLAMLATMLATSCSNEEIVEMNADPLGEAIDFRPSVASPTRATATTFSNLGDFNVIAKGIHANSGALYKAFMVGVGGDKDEGTGEIIVTPSLAQRSALGANSGIWKLSEQMYWPTGINDAVFWAFSDRKHGEGVAANGTCITSGSIGFLETLGPQLKGYQPLKADLKQEPNSPVGWCDGDVQRDLVSAFCKQTKNPHVNLNFHHLLSQVRLLASSNRMADNRGTRIVNIKGAWLVNAVSSGTLSAEFTYDQSTQEASDAPVWKVSSGLQSYGAYYDGSDRTVPVVVNGAGAILNLTNGSADKAANLMLIPQQREAWDGKSATTSQAYILLLCRVTLEHYGEITVDPDNEAVSGTNKEGYHYHQLFPVMRRYDENAYGLTAVPVPINWEIGKIYSYNLDICGDNSGAGQYPPNLPATEADQRTYLENFVGGEFKLNGNGPGITNIITTVPDDKEVGDYVLDDAIQFSVTVGGWEEGGAWNNGNGTKSTAGKWQKR